MPHLDLRQHLLLLWGRRCQRRLLLPGLLLLQGRRQRHAGWELP